MTWGGGLDRFEDHQPDQGEVIPLTDLVDKTAFKPRISVDWDGTCVPARWPEMPREWLPGAENALRILDGLGFEIVIFSCRVAPVLFGTDDEPRDPNETAKDIRYIQSMLNEAGLGHVEIWTRPYKPPAQFYVDDRAIQFTNWYDAVGEILEPVLS